jgi:hypothetical protein
LAQLDGVRTDELTGEINYKTEFVPLNQFISHFKEDPNWMQVMDRQDSPFMKLLELEGMFVKTHEQIV